LKRELKLIFLIIAYPEQAVRLTNNITYILYITEENVNINLEIFSYLCIKIYKFGGKSALLSAIGAV